MNVKDMLWEPHPEAYEIRKSAALAITRVLEWNDIYEKQKERIIKYVLLWDLTEGAEKNYPGVRGKYFQLDKKYNLRYWSQDAIDTYIVNNTDKRYKQLRHEHVLERDKLMKFLESDISPTEKIEILSQPENVPACVVTIEENNKLNKIKNAYAWERYNIAKIKVYDRLNSEYANIQILQKTIDPLLLR